MKKIIFIFIFFFASLNAQKLKGIGEDGISQSNIYKIIKVPPKPSQVGGVLLMGLLTGFLNFMGGPAMRDSLVYIGNLESKNKVLEILGKPEQSERYFADLLDEWHEVLTYKGLNIYFLDNGHYYSFDMTPSSYFPHSDYVVGTTFKLQIGKAIDPSLLEKYEYRYDYDPESQTKNYILSYYVDGEYADQYFLVRTDKHDRIILIREGDY